jgi:hypothetical protein
MKALLVSALEEKEAKKGSHLDDWARFGELK